MRKYDQYKQDKITAEQYQAFVEAHLLANSMLFRNSYDAEIISRFVKYIDVYSESEIEIVFNVDDVFFKKILDELE